MSAMGVETMSVPRTTAAVQIRVGEQLTEIIEADEAPQHAEAVDVVHRKRDDLPYRPQNDGRREQEARQDQEIRQGEPVHAEALKVMAREKLARHMPSAGRDESAQAARVIERGRPRSISSCSASR